MEQPEQRARGVSRRKADLEVFQAAFGAMAVLNRLNQGVVVIDAHRRTCFLNRVARAICAQADGLRLQGSALMGTAMPDASRLDLALGRALSDRQAVTLRVTRSSRKRPLIVSISPLAPTELSLGAAGPAAIALINDPDRGVAFPQEHLIQTYDLTPAEARVTQLLLEGSETAAIARKLGIQRETARTHMRRVLAKTGTHRQSELVRQLLSEVGWGARVEDFA